MRQFGKPQLEVIMSEEDLVRCDGRIAAFPIYRWDINND